MLTFSFPANYKRYVAAELAIVLARIGRDVNCRSDADPRVRALADVPDPLYDAPSGEAGTITLLLVETVPLVAVTDEEQQQQSADHLHAIGLAPVARSA